MTMAERHSPTNGGLGSIANGCVFRKWSGAIAELSSAVTHRRRCPTAVYLGFLQLVTATTVVLLGCFRDIFVLVRKNLWDTTLMNVLLRAASRRCVLGLFAVGDSQNSGVSRAAFVTYMWWFVRTCGTLR